jgi:glycine C-acetyltransferase
VVAACRASIALLQRQPERVEQLWTKARYFKQQLTDLGLDLGKSQTPITPVIVGEEERAHRLSDRLRELGVFVQSVTFPTVPRGTARIRIMVSASHSTQDLDEAVNAIDRATSELGLR